MRLIPKIPFLSLAAFVMTTPEVQQVSPTSAPDRPRGGSPAIKSIHKPGVSNDMEKSLETQKSAWDAYQRCISQNQQAFKLYSITRTLIDVRNNKSRYMAVMNNPRARAGYKEKSYDEVVAEAMSVYRQNGGLARSIDEIAPLQNPCAYVEPSPKLPADRGGREQKLSVSARTSAAISATEVQSESGASQVAPIKWVKVQENAANIQYIDPTTIRKNQKSEKSNKDEDIRQAWLLIDFKIKTPGSGASGKALVEYDCKNGKSRTIRGTAVSGQMGKGDVVLNYDASDWAYQPPNSIGGANLKFVCSW
jgi:surface-adhesin protein E